METTSECSSLPHGADWRAVRMEAILAANPVATVILHERRIVACNRLFEAMFGYSAGELDAVAVRQLYPDDAAYQAIGAAFYPAVVQGGAHQIETAAQRRSGASFWILLHGALLDPGEPNGAAIFTVQDITEHKMALARLSALNEQFERRIAQRTAELEAANRELEAFSYASSHDLRAPLRALRGFTRILIEEHAGALPEDARRLTERIATAGEKMEAMSDGLLELARLSGAALRRKRVDLAALARSAWSELIVAEPARTVQFNAPDSCPADCDPVLICNVLQNLLGNAFKYSRHSADAKVKFGETLLGGERVYYVQDNGAGFDMAHAGKLFNAFQRLHPAKKFEGTGVGLVTVRRIVERHGGRIWAEASPGKGACFYFTLTAPAPG